MFEAQIREHSAIPAAAADPKRECNARDDLKAGRKIDRTAKPG
jgi:hypothetical protein